MGDGTASPRVLEGLYDRYAGVVYSLAYRIVGDRTVAEEVLVEVFERAWRRGPAQPTFGGPALVWFVEVTRAVSFDLTPESPPFDSSTGREGRIRQLGPSQTDGLGSNTVDGVADHQVDAALTALRPDRRRAIVLAFFRGWTSREIAVALGVSESTVNGWLTEVASGLRAATATLAKGSVGTNRFSV